MASDNLYDLVIYGINAEGHAYEVARAKVAALLGLEAAEVDDAMAMGARVVTAGIAERVAQEHFIALRDLGVQCNLRPSARSGRSLSLIPMSLEREYVCPSCQHEHVYQRDEQPPEQCVGCGLVFSKYAKVQAEKEERERIRAALLAQHGNLLAQEERDRLEREAAERRARLEEEIRRELGLPKALASRRGLLGTAAAVLVFGIGVGVAGGLLLSKSGDAPAVVLQSDSDASTSAEAQHPALKAHLVVAGLESAPSKDVAAPGDVVGLAPVRATPEGNLSELQIDALYEQQVARQTDALFAAGNATAAAQLLEQSGNPSQSVRRASAAAVRRARSGNAATVAPTFDALAASVTRRPPTTGSRFADLAHIAHDQIDAGLADGATTQVERLRQWTTQLGTPADKVVASATVGSLLSQLGRRDEATKAFQDANTGLPLIADRASRLAVVVSLARSYADAGNGGAALMLIEDATQSAIRVADAAKRVAVLKDIAHFHVESGNAKAALQVTAAIDNPAVRAEVELSLTDALLGGGDLPSATDIANGIVVPEYRVRALARVAVAQQTSSNPLFRALTAATLQLARSEVAQVAAPADQAMILSELGRAAAKVGDSAFAASCFTDAERFASSIEASGARYAVLAVIAGNLSRADQIANAQRVAAQIGDPIAAASATDDIVRVQQRLQIASTVPAASPTDEGALAGAPSGSAEMAGAARAAEATTASALGAPAADAR